MLTVMLTRIITYNYNEFMKNNKDFSDGEEGQLKRSKLFLFAPGAKCPGSGTGRLDTYALYNFSAPNMLARRST